MYWVESIQQPRRNLDLLQNDTDSSVRNRWKRRCIIKQNCDWKRFDQFVHRPNKFLVKPMVGGSMVGVKGVLQSRVAKLLKALIPNDFPGLFRRRLRDLEVDEAAIQHFVSQPLGTLSLEFKDIFSSLPLSVPMAILRTWSNGWFTTTRMHESEVFPCIFA